MADDNVIVTAMARALFVSTWADNEEENGRTYPQQDLMDVAPPTPREFFNDAHQLVGRIEEANHTNIWAIYFAACKADGDTEIDRSRWEDEKRRADFGHYLAMMALGHGVSWFDDHADFGLTVPNIEVSL